ncbi:MAG: hypothetical protein EOP81_14975 [Variovorax sp.]|nr:MAG: hypothetical protein EOP81_14975 [Variovorax sp.]
MNLEQMLVRSGEFDDEIFRLLDPGSYQLANGDARIRVSASAASLSVDHCRAVRLLIANDIIPSGAAVMRLQFEALTRAVWLLFAADDASVAVADAPLDAESQKRASKLPGASPMLAELARSPAPGAAAPTAMLGRFKEMQWAALNSFVHGGIHPLRRQSDGYPERMVVQLLECSNALLSMSGMMLAILTGSTVLSARMNRVHVGFEDCLTPILPSY